MCKISKFCRSENPNVSVFRVQPELHLKEPNGTDSLQKSLQANPEAGKCCWKRGGRARGEDRCSGGKATEKEEDEEQTESVSTKQGWNGFPSRTRIGTTTLRRTGGCAASGGPSARPLFIL